MEIKHPAKSHSFRWVQQTDLCFLTRGTGSLPEIKFCRDTHGKRIRLGSGRFGQARLGDVLCVLSFLPSQLFNAQYAQCCKPIAATSLPCAKQMPIAHTPPEVAGCKHKLQD